MMRATARAGEAVLGRKGFGALGFFGCGGGLRLGTVVCRERCGLRAVLLVLAQPRSCRLAMDR